LRWFTPWPMASVIGGTSHIDVARTVPGSVVLSLNTQLEEFIDRTLSGCNCFTGRSPALSSVTPDGDRGSAHGPHRRGLTFRSRCRTPSRPGLPGRGHLDPTGALTPPRVPRIVGHHGAGPRLPACPGDVGATYPPSAAVACPSHKHTQTYTPVPAAFGAPRRSLTWPSRTYRRPRAGPLSPGLHGTTGPSSSSSTTRSRIDKPLRRV
jgi:hypothetical protein